jgi:hypothetical protein
MAPSFYALRDNDINSGLGRSPCGFHRSNLVYNFYADRVCECYIRGRITPKEGQHWDLLLYANFDMLFDWELKQQIDAERLAGQPAEATNLLPEQWRRIASEGDDAEAASIADSRRQFQAGDVRPHWSSEYRDLYTKQTAKWSR